VLPADHGAGADWVTCLRLLERAAAAANVTHDGAASTAASMTHVGGGCLFVPGGELNEIKNRKIMSLPYGHRPVIQTQQPTKNTRAQHRR